MEHHADGSQRGAGVERVLERRQRLPANLGVL